MRYKQGVEGDCTLDQQPTDVEKIPYWHAWKRKRGTPAIKAKEELVHKIRDLSKQIGLDSYI